MQLDAAFQTFLDRAADDITRLRHGLSREQREAIDLETGDCWLAALQPAGVRVIKADPRVLVADEVLVRIDRGEGAPEVTLTRQSVPDRSPGEPPVAGALLRIDGVNQKVIYRLTRYVPEWRCWVAEWPD